MWSIYHVIFRIGCATKLNPQASWDGSGFAGFAGLADMRTYGAAVVFKARVLFKTLTGVWVEQPSGNNEAMPAKLKGVVRWLRHFGLCHPKGVASILYDEQQARVNNGRSLSVLLAFSTSTTYTACQWPCKDSSVA